MEIYTAVDLARVLMNENGLNDWELKLTRSRTIFGLCIYPENGRPGQIRLSAPYIDSNDQDDVEDTVKHEIAHALTPFDSHGPLWQNKCVELGCNPEKVKGSSFRLPGRYQARCSSCQNTLHRYCRPSAAAYHCIKCGPLGGILQWIDTNNEREKA